MSWKKSASLILLGQQTLLNGMKTNGHNLFDYSILLLQRSPNMRFAPDYSVFPGGTLDPSDLSEEWPHYIKEFLPSTVDFNLFKRTDIDMYNDIPNPYPGLVMRICSIRETFEETGFLVCSTRNNSPRKNVFAYLQTINKIDYWRSACREDGAKFLEMCKIHNLCPDIMALHEWSEHLTPSFSDIRFDNLLYITSIEDTPTCIIASDDPETVSAQWLPPNIWLQNYVSNKTKFLPPQLYELSQMENFQNLFELNKFIIERVVNGVKRSIGMLVKCSDSALILYPGDTLYPSNIDVNNTLILFDGTVEEFNKQKIDKENQYLNRLVMNNETRQWEIQRTSNNISFKNGTHSTIASKL
ncbi:unnamed protein product [Didymodactylos carnosus]|uniref:Nudix hydrolase domain-containing protein n=1 Tax=Didymodactylos carnosus TaxID=1234261 RepID=A0A813XZQ7_9BILA|nr:unnamed protein product [Didymodactylos carnosus]CAF0874484.1 unnamed protein product [Didymodactylos carnosus]CAF3625357.1 unnamed protein product [Didymodactylos carnosus]CAF3661537.1 unnamed protein product [Didymodactylos carnosus]